MAIKTMKRLHRPEGLPDHSTFERSPLGPEKGLTKPVKKTGGRNNAGRVTSRHRRAAQAKVPRGDFRREKTNIRQVKTMSTTEPSGEDFARELRRRGESATCGPVVPQGGDPVIHQPSAEIAATPSDANFPLAAHHKSSCAPERGPDGPSPGTYAHLMAKERPYAM